MLMKDEKLDAVETELLKCLELLGREMRFVIAVLTTFKWLTDKDKLYYIHSYKLCMQQSTFNLLSSL